MSKKSPNSKNDERRDERTKTQLVDSLDVFHHTENENRNALKKRYDMTLCDLLHGRRVDREFSPGHLTSCFC